MSSAVLIAPKLAEASQVTQYTVSTGKTMIDALVAANVGTANASISINVGSGASADTLLLDAKTLKPGETYSVVDAFGAVMLVGDAISTLASDASTISIRASGRENI